MISAKKINIHYDRKQVIYDLCMDINEGEIISIIGPNGSGKSTILKALSRLIKPSNGVAYLNGYDIQKLPTREVAKRLSILSQHNHSPADCTVRDLVSYGRMPYKKWYEFKNKYDDEVVDWAINVTKLTSLADRFISTLSGGERQRAWIAMTLAQKTKVLMLDEPTTYLDISHQLEVMELLYEINRKYRVTIIMVLHDLNQASKYSDRIFVINKGRLVMQGSPHKVITKRMLRDVYNIEAQITIDKTTSKPMFFAISPLKGYEDNIIRIKEAK
ncbi:iron complex transport system ATP-binding protein [Caloranaerobacter azorensis DSM 13643]|uniref:Iron complex transport system ATP-binding protein n=1 Tax=Caloranaerobacter azorensis DSM 13643 TaxID=1121264 RepID=A0A1M5V9U5_9FIRM|nr:ABC transporter ATP-binding protein [Caloranaerobacter azorensis]SHH71995.1 iron complex transport system ATP-binding protein [Caloranaerobacter azorensis DSM 13643]